MSAMRRPPVALSKALKLHKHLVLRRASCVSARCGTPYRPHGSGRPGTNCTAVLLLERCVDGPAELARLLQNRGRIEGERLAIPDDGAAFDDDVLHVG